MKAVLLSESVKKELNRLLIGLSWNNIDALRSGNQDKTKSIIKKILGSTYFQCRANDRETYDCHSRITQQFKEEVYKINSSHPFCLAPITNERFFYCRGNNWEDTRSLYDTIIPSRDYSSHSYEWSNLFYSEHADEALEQGVSD